MSYFRQCPELSLFATQTDLLQHITVEALVGVLPHFQPSFDLKTGGIEKVTHLLVVDLQHAEGHLINAKQKVVQVMDAWMGGWVGGLID